MLKEDQEKYNLCSECHEQLTSDEDVKNKCSQVIDLSNKRCCRTNVCKFIPIKWRIWRVQSLSEIFPNVYSEINISAPTPIFEIKL